MSRETFNFLLEIIKLELKKKDNRNHGQSGRNTITSEKQLLITIWTLATPDSYR